VTLLIIVYAILKLFPIKSIAEIMVEGSFKNIQRYLHRLYQRPEKRQRHGIALRKVGRGIQNMLWRIRLHIRSWIGSVRNVARSFKATIFNGSALRLVFQGVDETPRRIGNRDSANSVIGNSGSISTQRRSVAVDPAPRTFVPVYNLTVQGAHEYYANGILVSNCDSLEYVVWRIVSRDAEFLDLWTSSRSGRKTITDRRIP
jgi:hypothetical protein